MKKTEFINRVFEIVRSRNMRTKIDSRGHHTICFNATSGTWLHEGHLGLLFDLGVLRGGIQAREINDMLHEIAPGRTSAHKRIREILKEIQNEPAQHDAPDRSDPPDTINTAASL